MQKLCRREAQRHKNNSKIKTTAQQDTDTENNPAPNHAAAMPMISAAAPATGDWVASRIAGNVITASVT